MFDVSGSELLVIAIVGLLVIGPEELPVVIRYCRKIILKIKELSREFTSALDGVDGISDLKKEVEKLNNDIKTIVDLEGNLQPTYDISDVMPEIEKARNNKNV